MTIFLYDLFDFFVLFNSSFNFGFESPAKRYFKN